MLVLKAFKNDDAKTILSWFSDRESFRKWSADRYSGYPIDPNEMITMYSKASINYQPMCMWDDDKLVGSILLRRISDDDIRFGFIVVSNEIRGMGYGKKMLELAKEYTINNLSCKKISIGVFDSNPSAYNCYIKSGFKETGEIIDFSVDSYNWKCIMLEYLI